MYNSIMIPHKLQYRLHCLDGRHSHRDRFRYYLSFPASMTQLSGPLCFNRAMAWCVQTWGWSAEVNQTAKILSWTLMITQFPRGILPETPEHCNPCWSWSNRLGSDLRIYLAGDAELAFFQLAHPVDQK
jgi:hypothetical protein